MANDTWRAAFGFFREIESEQDETKRIAKMIFYLLCINALASLGTLLALTVLIAKGM